MARGKRKAEDTQSPDGRASKRRADAEDMDEQSASEEEEDQGRIESQQMMMVMGIIKPKDDGWVDKMHKMFDNDEAELNQLLDGKERELADLDSHFHRDLRALLTDVLAAPASKQRKNTSTTDTFYLRPAHEHASLLFTKSEGLINYYNQAADCVETGRQELATDHTEAFEKDKNDAAEMLHTGRELALRQIQRVLKRPDDQTSANNMAQPLFTEQKLDDVASIFKLLRDESKEEMEDVQHGQAERVDMADGQGLFPLIHITKKGVKKLAGHLLVEED
ncbi:hypothetical protein M436DRAFT_81600 [Aureobasidium namibiae CBS 147.97]|uniref:Uncharacterized protein n=1 Tax=Aureobasidium namibiae CBS 147.97 TaxID=1043004 RepID=A0A074WJA3_9PEZI